VWDATVVAAKMMATAWEACPAAEWHPSSVNVTCLLRQTVGKYVPYNGTTSFIYLNPAGDRSGVYSIYNVLDGSIVREGSVRYSPQSGSLLDLDLTKHIWSDGSTNRTTVPLWGQSELNSTSPTPPPVSNGRLQADSRHTDRVGVWVAAFLGLVLAVVLGALVHYRRQQRLRKLRPTDFCRIIEALEREHGTHAVRHGISLKARLPQELIRRDVMVNAKLDDGQFGEVCGGVWSVRIQGVQTNVAVAIKKMLVGSVSDSDEAAEMDAHHRAAFAKEAAVTWQVGTTPIALHCLRPSSVVPFFGLAHLCTVSHQLTELLVHDPVFCIVV
jgi:hypothetical protein